MQGKILADGLISGNDGKRYTYSAGDLKNAQGKSLNAIIGSEVDFEVAQSDSDKANADSGANGTANANGASGKARDIYITKQAFDIQHKLFDGDLQSVKFKVYAAAGLCVLGLIPIVGWFFLLLAVILLVLVVISVNKGSQSTTLLKNFIMSLIIPFVGGIIIAVVGSISLFGNVFSTASSGSIGVANLIFGGIGILGVIVGVIVALICWVFMYRYYKELSYITNDKLFFYAFVCRFIGCFLSFIPLIGVVGKLFFLADLILEAIAWFRVKEIRKSYSARDGAIAA